MKVIKYKYYNQIIINYNVFIIINIFVIIVIVNYVMLFMN